MNVPALTFKQMEARVIFERRFNEVVKESEERLQREEREAQAERAAAVAKVRDEWALRMPDLLALLPEWAHAFIQEPVITETDPQTQREELQVLQDCYSTLVLTFPFPAGSHTIAVDFWRSYEIRGGERTLFPWQIQNFDVYQPQLYQFNDERAWDVRWNYNGPYSVKTLDQALIWGGHFAEVARELLADARQRNAADAERAARYAAERESTPAAAPKPEPLTCTKAERALLDLLSEWLHGELAEYAREF